MKFEDLIGKDLLDMSEEEINELIEKLSIDDLTKVVTKVRHASTKPFDKGKKREDFFKILQGKQVLEGEE